MKTLKIASVLVATSMILIGCGSDFTKSTKDPILGWEYNRTTQASIEKYNEYVSGNAPTLIDEWQTSTEVDKQFGLESAECLVNLLKKEEIRSNSSVGFREEPFPNRILNGSDGSFNYWNVLRTEDGLNKCFNANGDEGKYYMSDKTRDYILSKLRFDDEYNQMIEDVWFTTFSEAYAYTDRTMNEYLDRLDTCQKRGGSKSSCEIESIKKTFNFIFRKRFIAD